MVDYDAFVVEIEPDNSYMVCIDGVFSGTVTDNGTIDDSDITFESALSWAIELMLTNEYEFKQIKEFMSRTYGGVCRKYVVSIDENA
jgi:hypothetical protein